MRIMDTLGLIAVTFIYLLYFSFSSMINSIKFKTKKNNFKKLESLKKRF